MNIISFEQLISDEVYRYFLEEVKHNGGLSTDEILDIIGKVCDDETRMSVKMIQKIIKSVNGRIYQFYHGGNFINPLTAKKGDYEDDSDAN